MEILTELWQQYLFIPLLNFLIWLYRGPAYESLGLAVMYMTVALRLILVPFSIITERNEFRFKSIKDELAAVQKEFKDDPVERKAVLRTLLRKARIKPWASAALLGIQLLALVLLYQVFVGGMTPVKLGLLLYPSVPQPDLINTQFFGIDIAERNWPAALLVGVLLYFQIWRSQKGRRESLTSQDVLFRYGFPALSFAILFSLPAVKTVFILTAMGFSYIMHLCQPFFTRRLRAVKERALQVQSELLH